MGFKRVSQRLLDLQSVDVSPAILFDRETSGLGQFANDLLHHALGNPYSISHVPQSSLRVLVDAPQNVGVIGQKRPGCGRCVQKGRRCCVVLGFLHDQALWQPR